ncbi:nuclear transport factor 2 family protein [Candidatus Bathyarchaeota archaeon]|nr:nuclear transport factor 2 family protein [Candidatus Bathyarchaeota archaeon]
MENQLIYDKIEKWVDFWNSYDLDKFDNLFLNDMRVTYFSSERQGLIKGYNALIHHHEEFGFVKGGKIQQTKLWLEDIDIKNYNEITIVCAIWYFRRNNNPIPQKGPVTIIYQHTSQGWKIIHMNFSNYK